VARRLVELRFHAIRRRARHTCGHSRRRNRARVHTNHSRSLVSHALFHGRAYVHTVRWIISSFRLSSPSSFLQPYYVQTDTPCGRTDDGKTSEHIRLRLQHSSRLTGLNIVKVQSLRPPFYHLACELIRRADRPCRREFVGASDGNNRIRIYCNKIFVTTAVQIVRINLILLDRCFIRVNSHRISFSIFASRRDWTP